MEVAGGFAPLVGDTGGGEERPDGGNTYLRRQRFGSCDTNQGGGGSEDRSGTPTAEEAILLLCVVLFEGYPFSVKV